jgi:hypothetical protein
MRYKPITRKIPRGFWSQNTPMLETSAHNDLEIAVEDHISSLVWVKLGDVEYALGDIITRDLYGI